MIDAKCPFCGEPSYRIRHVEKYFRCGTVGPDENGEYSPGHACDKKTWTRLLREKEAEIERLRKIIRGAIEQTEADPKRIEFILRRIAEAAPDEFIRLANKIGQETREKMQTETTV